MFGWDVACRTAVQGWGGCGDRHLKGPTGGAAKGTPRKDTVPKSVVLFMPWMGPYVVCTTQLAPAPAVAAAATSQTSNIGKGRGTMVPTYPTFGLSHFEVQENHNRKKK